MCNYVCIYIYVYTWNELECSQTWTWMHRIGWAFPASTRPQPRRRPRTRPHWNGSWGLKDINGLAGFHWEILVFLCVFLDFTNEIWSFSSGISMWNVGKKSSYLQHFHAFPTAKVQKTRCAARSFLARICGRLALGKELQGSPSGSSVLLCFNTFQPKQKNVAREE